MVTGAGSSATAYACASHAPCSPISSPTSERQFLIKSGREAQITRFEAHAVQQAIEMALVEHRHRPIDDSMETVEYHLASEGSGLHAASPALSRVASTPASPQLVGTTGAALHVASPSAGLASAPSIGCPLPPSLLQTTTMSRAGSLANLPRDVDSSSSCGTCTPPPPSRRGLTSIVGCSSSASLVSLQQPLGRDVPLVPSCSSTGSLPAGPRLDVRATGLSPSASDPSRAAPGAPANAKVPRLGTAIAASRQASGDGRLSAADVPAGSPDAPNAGLLAQRHTTD